MNTTCVLEEVLVYSHRITGSLRKKVLAKKKFALVKQCVHTCLRKEDNEWEE